MDAGTWTGGMVDGYGYWGEVIQVTGYRPQLTGAISEFENWCNTAWDTVADFTENFLNKVTHATTMGAAATATGFTGGYLDFKYNGADAGNGVGKIPFEEYQQCKSEYRAYNFSWENGFVREKDRLPDNPSYDDVKEMVQVIMMPGFFSISVGGNAFVNYMVTTAGKGGVRYGVNELMNLGDKNK